MRVKERKKRERRAWQSTELKLFLSHRVKNGRRNYSFRYRSTSSHADARAAWNELSRLSEERVFDALSPRRPSFDWNSLIPRAAALLTTYPVFMDDGDKARSVLILGLFDSERAETFSWGVLEKRTVEFYQTSMDGVRSFGNLSFVIDGDISDDSSVCFFCPGYGLNPKGSPQALSLDRRRHSRRRRLGAPDKWAEHGEPAIRLWKAGAGKSTLEVVGSKFELLSNWGSTIAAVAKAFSEAGAVWVGLAPGFFIRHPSSITSPNEVSAILDKHAEGVREHWVLSDAAVKPNVSRNARGRI